MTQLRVLYSSNAFWAASGYGVQGRSLLPRLAATEQIGGKQNVAQFAWYGLHGGMHEVDGFRIYPGGNDPYGNDVIEAHTKDFRANVVISLIDVWVMKETAKRIAPALWLPWLPIDHEPVPQVVLESLQGAYLPLTYSKWGHDLLEKAGVQNHYIPHGIETDVFRVIEDVDKVQRFRRQIFRNAPHVTVIVAANKGYPDRKAFQVQLRAWAAWAKDKPGALLYIHTEPSTMYGGLDFAALVRALGIEAQTLFPDRYQYFKGLPAEMMALIYNAADVYMGASMSEGFGIPLIEAQACGLPVVTTDFSAMPELVRWGKAIKPADMVWTPLNSWQAWPDAHGIKHALDDLWEQWRAGGGMWDPAQRQYAQDAIHGEFSWDAIVRDQWTPLLEHLVTVVPQDGQRKMVPA
jgi:glycosyltransferase involved in cell wall biosynthesis